MMSQTARLRSFSRLTLVRLQRTCSGSTLISSVLILCLFSQLAHAADPIARDDDFSTGSGQAVAGLLSANDENLDGPADSYAKLSDPANGVASVNSDGSFDYAPNIGFAGLDTFSYGIDDGAGGTSSAQVNVSVAAASDFISSVSSTLFTPEDTQVPLGLLVAPDLYDGGALQDLISTDAGFRSDSAGATPVVSTIPVGASSIAITGYSTQSRNTSGTDSTNDDYQLLNVRINLVDGTSSGRVAFINHGRLTNLDQYAWRNVPVGQSVLSDPSKVTGFYATGDSDPTFSVVAGALQIVETHTLESAYVIEYMTSDGDSTNFLSAGNTVQNAGESSSSLTFPTKLEPAAGKKGFIALNATSAAAGTNSSVEHKGFARLLIDLEARSISGSIAAQRGENANNTVTYSFEGYPLIDKRSSGATPVSILTSSAAVLGDTTANASVMQNPTLYIDASGQLVIERASGFAAVFTSMYTAEYYERTGFSSIASFVSVGSADALFDSSPPDGVDEFGEPIDKFVFSVPASARVGLLQMSWDTIGGSDLNENIGMGFAVIDLESGISSGSVTFIRAKTPDLLSWDGVPFGTTFFGATNAANNPLYQSNKTAGKFTDPFAETAKFLVVANPDGSRTLTFSATSNGGTQTYRDYRGNANVSWLGNEPFSISGVPTAGLLSLGSPDGYGGWEIDFADLPSLAYLPAPHESGLVSLSFGLSSTGETENIELRIAPIVDAPSLSSTDAVGYVDNPFGINIVVADSADTDGSETHPASVTLGNVPGSVSFSASTGTVIDMGGGVWVIDRAALATLMANAPVVVDASITVSVLQVDERDVDSDLTIEDIDNGNGVDEYDELVVSDSFLLRVQAVPTVTSLLVNNGTPVISGTASPAAGETLMVTVNGVVYPDSGSDLVLNGDGTWTLTIPVANALIENTYAVMAELTHTSGTLGSDTTSDELVVDLTPPPAPGVTSQTTMDDTPTISGTLAIASGNVLSVSVNGVTYTEGDGQLLDNGDGTWDLEIPAANTLPDALYQVIATLTDAAGNTSTDGGVDELLVDTMAPPSPGVTSQITNDTTPVIEGTATLVAGDVLSVEVDGVVYTAGAGDLVDNGDGTWTLSVPAVNSLIEAVYDITAIITDVALNVSVDPSSSELTIDLTAPAAPTVTAQLTNQTTPTLIGTASVGGGESLTVSLDGVVYTEGDGNLFNNGDGTWMLTVPNANALVEGTLEVAATVTDAAGNSTSDSSTIELEVDLTPPPIPTVVAQITASATPTITGGATTTASDMLSVELKGILYVAGDGNLIDNGDSTWSLTIPVGNELIDGSYDVQVRISDTAGNIALDGSVVELVVDLTPPPAPGVTSQTTNNTTPLISGTTAIASGLTLRVDVDGVVYVAGDGSLDDNGDGTWDLTIPPADVLVDALYQVIATLTDAAGNISTDAGIDELLVDTAAPPSPGVTSLTTSDTTPVIEGSAIVATDETLTVTVNAVLYTAGDGHLVDNGDGTWALSIPPSDTLTDGGYDVTATVTDAALNTSTDPSSSELLVDTLAPVAPMVVAQVVNSTNPIVEGTASVSFGEILTVDVDGVVYSAGDGALVDNGDGTWSLTIPVGNELIEAVYDVMVTVTDGAGNSASDSSVSELEIDLTPPTIPTVLSLVTNIDTPTLSGTTSLASGDTLSVSVNGVTYVEGDGMLSTSGGNWTLVIPAADVLAEATWEVLASISDAAGNVTSDLTSDELIIDLTAPPVPGVTSQSTSNDMPVIEGTVAIGAGMTLSVEVNGIVYVEGDGNLMNNGDGTWALSIPVANALVDAVYQVVATLSDAAGNASTEVGVDELLIDTMTPSSPGVTSQTINTGTPVISGTAIVALGETLTVLVNGVNYTAGDGDLVDNTDGTWTLTIPAANTLAEATYDVSATVTDAALNTSADPSSSELTIDLTAPVAPMVDAQLSNSTTPTLSGSATVAAGETLSVTVNGVTYVAGDGNVVDNGDGTWTLVIPTGNELPEGALEVSVIVTDAAGNSTSDASMSELEIDLTPPAVPTVASLITNQETPSVSGTATLAPGDTLSVSVDGVTYVDGMGMLSTNAGSWTLVVPTANALSEATWEVLASISDAAGNVTDDLTSDELIVDLTPPPVPGVTSQTTSDGTPVIEGLTAIGTGMTLSVEVNSIVYVEGDANLVNNGDGTWVLSIPVANALVDALYQVEATLTDVAGNASTDAGVDELLIDTMNPLSPGVTSQTINTGTPVIAGTAIVGVGETLTVQVNGVSYTAGDGDLVDNTDGTWALAIPTVNTLVEATYDVTATVTDAALNISTDPSSSELTIDLTAPVAPRVDAQLTNSTTPTLSGTATVGVGETLSVMVNGVAYLAGDGNLLDNGDGTWTLAIPTGNELVEAGYEVLVTVTDAAGNSTSDVSVSELQIDLTASSAPTVLITSDVNDDGSLSLAEPADPVEVSVGLPAEAEAGDRVEISDGNSLVSVVLSAADVATGSSAASFTRPLEGLSLSVVATLVDRAGNVSLSGDDSALVDTLPTLAPIVMITEDADDNAQIGIAELIGDINIKILLPGDAIAGDTLSVTIDGNDVISVLGLVNITAGAVNFVLVAPGDGNTVSVVASITDAAGNASLPGNDTAQLDLTVPNVPTINFLISNTGTPMLSGDASLAPGETLALVLDEQSFTDGDGSLVVNGDGTWALAVQTINTLLEGIFDVSATITDLAGNSTVDLTNNELTVDLTAPVEPTVDAQLTNSATPTLSGTATVAAGETLSVTVNGVMYTAGDGNLIDNGNGTWTLVIPTGNELSEGALEIGVTVTDAAGNSTSDASMSELEVDLTPPVVPTVNVQLSNSATPTLSGTATVDAGETLSVTVNGVIYTADDGILVDNGDGTWTLLIPTGNELTEGILDVSVSVMDAAGNTSSDTSVSELEIDLTPPVIPTVDTQLTNSTTPILGGTATVATGETLSVTVNGVSYSAGDGNLADNGDGTWTLVIPIGNELPEGAQDVSVTLVDAAGNASSDITADELMVDLTPPPAPGVTSQSTSNDTPVIEGTTTIGTGLLLSVEVNGIVYVEGDGNLVNNGDGTWILSIPVVNALSDALYQVVATLTDAPGNASTESGVDELLIDTMIPSSPGVTSLTINTGTPVIAGTAVVGVGENLTVVVNAVTYTAGDGDLIDNADGTWALSIPVANSLAEASYDVTASVTDAVLNISTDPSSSELTIDLTAPVSPTVDAQLSNSSTPTLSGTATVVTGETLTVIVNGVTYSAGDGNLVDNGDGTWTLVIPTGNELPEGDLGISVTVADTAGNSTSDASVSELEIDLTPPVTPTVNALLTNLTAPTLNGTATVVVSESLSVLVNGVVYVAGDGNLVDNGDGTWMLVIPAGNELPEGALDVSVTVADTAGNVADDLTSDELIIDLTAPPVPGVTSQSTSNDMPVIEGTVAIGAGMTLSVEVNGIVYVEGDGNLMNNGDGTWALSIPVANALVDALYQVEATLTDVAGNASADAGVDELLIDTMNPLSPGVTSQTINTGTPVIAGTAIVGVGETLTVQVNGVSYTAGDGDLVDNTDGTWALAIPTVNTLVEATYDVTASVTDAALNISTDPSSSELTIDLTAPVAPRVDAQLTNSTTPTLSGTATVGVGETLSVMVNGVTYLAGDGNLLDNGDGTWTLAIPTGNELVEAGYEVLVTVTDAAGNSTSDVSVSELQIDLTPPMEPTVDTQLSNSTTPTLSGAATVAAGETLSVIVYGVTYVAGDGNLVHHGDGTWTLAIPTGNELPEGALEIGATITDAAGNSISDSSVSELEIDLTPPPTPGVTSQSTSDNTPLIEGLTAISSGMTLSVEVDGISYVEGDGNLINNGDGTWGLSIPLANALSDALYQVVATLTDVAGNASTETGIDELLIDTMIPSSPGVTSQTINTGTPVITGTAVVGVGETLAVVVNGVTYTAGDGNLVDNKNSTWTLSVPAVNTLPEANYDVTATVTDAALNTSTDPSSSELTIDLTAPVAPTVNAQLTNSTTPTLSGAATVAAGETLSVTVNGVIYNAGDGVLVDNGDGTWTLAIPTGNELPEGALDVSVNVMDVAGNSTSDASVSELEIDLTSPAVPTVDAQLTNSSTPILSGTATVAAGEVLSVEVNGVTYIAGDGNLTDNGDGTWTLVIPAGSELPEGALEISVMITDTAGNSTSDASIIELQIDLTAPPAPGVTSQTTSDYTPLIKGTTTIGSGLTLSVEVNGIVYVEGDGRLSNNGDGTWALRIPPANVLVDALYQVVATLTDAAGNASIESGSDELLIDTVIPSSPGVTSLTINTGTPTVEGTATIGAGEMLTVVVNAVTYTAGDGNLVDNTDGTWTLTIPVANTLSEANYNVTASVTDVALNTSTDPSSSELTIDLTSPVAPTIDAQLTNSSTPVLSGTAIVAADETLSVLVNGVVYVAGDGNLVNNSDGTWTLVIPTGNDLPEGALEVSAIVTDEAGNSTDDVGTSELIIDLTPPPVPGVTSQSTSNDMPVIEGTVAIGAGMTLSVEVNGVVYIESDGNLVNNGDGTWVLSIPVANALVDALYQVEATLTDVAGNASTDAGVDELLIDTMNPLSPGVTSQTINTGTPVIAGTAIVGVGETLTVQVNGVSYTVGDGDLVDNSDGTWALAIPTANTLAEATYDVTASVTDAALNTSTDPSASELTVDQTAPVVPTVNAQVTNSSTPTLSGTATVAAGETLSVMVNGVTYVAGDGNLVDNGDGTWTLEIPFGNELPDGLYDVVVNTQDAAGNLSSSVEQPLRVDTVPPELSVTGLQQVTTFRPPLIGNAVTVDGAIVQVTDTAGNLVCDAVVMNGTWTCVPINDFHEGETLLFASIVDGAGNAHEVEFSVSVSEDFDGDGIPNAIEGFGDSDNDGVVDSADLDADNDGLPDQREGIKDTDGDGLPDYLDEDADNDGIADLVEALGIDDDGNFLVDGFIDIDGNGLSDPLQVTPLEAPDTDHDGIPDFLDVDSDQDGIPDLVETMGSDVDNDGRVDSFRDLDVNGVDDAIQLIRAQLIDSDDDGLPDYRDLDSDNDGIPDLVEVGGEDIDNDGVIDSAADINTNGIPDAVEAFYTGGEDNDQDGIDDLADASIAFGDDSDGDGILDAFDPDSDGDGRADNAFFDLSLGAAEPGSTPDSPQSESGVLRTGLSGRGGCSIAPGSNKTWDPLLVILSALAMLVLISRSHGLRNPAQCLQNKYGTAEYAAPVKLAIAVICLIASSSVSAQGLKLGPYVGVGFGQSWLEPDASELSIELEDKTDRSISVLLGLDLTPRLAIELALDDLGRSQLSDDAYVDYRIGSASLLVRGLNERKKLETHRGFSLYGRVGAARMDNSSNIPYVREHDTSLMFGGGIEFGFSNGLALRADITSFDTDAHRAGLFLLYRPWAQSSADTPVTAAKEAPLASLPESPGVETQLVAEQVGIDTEFELSVPEDIEHKEFVILFDLNSSYLGTKAMSTALNVAATLRYSPALEIRLTGYTDTSGKAEYNRWLAERRVLRVQTLLEEHGVNSSRIDAVVFGETSRFGPFDEVGKAESNRRVQVELIPKKL